MLVVGGRTSDPDTGYKDTNDVELIPLLDTSSAESCNNPSSYPNTVHSSIGQAVDGVVKVK